MACCFKSWFWHVCFRKAYERYAVLQWRISVERCGHLLLEQMGLWSRNVLGVKHVWLSHRFEDGIWTGKSTVSLSSGRFISLSTAVFYRCCLKSSSLLCIEALMWRVCACGLGVPSHRPRVCLQPKGGNGNMKKDSWFLAKFLVCFTSRLSPQLVSPLLHLVPLSWSL